MTLRKLETKYHMPKSSLHRVLFPNLSSEIGLAPYLTLGIENELMFNAVYLSGRGFGFTLDKVKVVDLSLVNYVDRFDPLLTSLHHLLREGFKPRHVDFGCF